jgi:hypothetical protein
MGAAPSAQGNKDFSHRIFRHSAGLPEGVTRCPILNSGAQWHCFHGVTRTTRHCVPVTGICDPVHIAPELG